jgi:hypothetical protein
MDGLLGASITAAGRHGWEGEMEPRRAQASLYSAMEVQKSRNKKKRHRAQPLKTNAHLRESPEAAGSCVCVFVHTIRDNVGARAVGDRSHSAASHLIVSLPMHETALVHRSGYFKDLRYR